MLVQPVFEALFMNSGVIYLFERLDTTEIRKSIPSIAVSIPSIMTFSPRPGHPHQYLITGDKSIDVNMNLELFSHVEIFIYETGRFV